MMMLETEVNQVIIILFDPLILYLIPIPLPIPQNSTD